MALKPAYQGQQRVASLASGHRAKAKAKKGHLDEGYEGDGLLDARGGGHLRTKLLLAAGRWPSISAHGLVLRRARSH